MNWIEIKFWEFVVWMLRKKYGANCEVSDLDEGILGETLSSEVVSCSGRCDSCRAKEAILFIEEHIELLI